MFSTVSASTSAFLACVLDINLLQNNSFIKLGTNDLQQLLVKHRECYISLLKKCTSYTSVHQWRLCSLTLNIHQLNNWNVFILKVVFKNKHKQTNTNEKHKTSKQTNKHHTHKKTHYCVLVNIVELNVPFWFTCISDTSPSLSFLFSTFFPSIS